MTAGSPLPPPARRIPLAVPDIGPAEARYLQECVDSGFVSSVGPLVDRFERLTAEAAGAGEAVAVSSGTAGLHVALTALGVGRDDLAIIPSFTFIATANAISHCGARPWIVDVDPEDWTMDPALLERVLARETVPGPDGGRLHVASGRRVAAVVPVYALGLPADMDRVCAAAAAYGLPVVADAAAALGSFCIDSQGGPPRRPGALGAALTMFSFNGNKTVTAGGGGAVVGSAGALIARVRHLSTTARFGRDYDHDEVGFNYRMTNVQAAVGCAQLERLDALVAAKRMIRAAYDAAIRDLPDSRPFPAPGRADSSCWLSGVLAPTEAAAERLRGALAARGVETRFFWKPIHLQRPYADAPRTPQPVAEDIWRRIVCLPSSSALSAEDLATTIDGLRAGLGRL
jgi:perosamine synthetase